MKAVVKAKQIGGSIGIIIPRDIVERERINSDDTLQIEVERVADLSFLLGSCKDVKISTELIMKEIDEGDI